MIEHSFQNADELAKAIADAMPQLVNKCLADGYALDELVLSIAPADFMVDVLPEKDASEATDTYDLMDVLTFDADGNYSVDGEAIASVADEYFA